MCGGLMQAQVTDLPFKLDRHCIRIIKDLPVQECVQCGKTLIDDSVMAEIEPLFDKEAHPSALEVMRYAA
jgi:YgiT-type zinc finger domain-containing protein